MIVSDQPNGNGENPLEDLAARLSKSLGGKPVQMRNDSAERVEGGQVTMQQSAAKQVQASALQMEESAAGLVRAGSVDAHESALGAVVTETAHLHESNAAVLVGQTIQADSVRSVLVVAARVDGSVKPVLTPLSALAAGAGFAATLLLVGRLFGALRRGRRRSSPHRSV